MEWVIIPKTTPKSTPGVDGSGCAKYNTCGVYTDNCPQYKCWINIEL